MRIQEMLKKELFYQTKEKKHWMNLGKYYKIKNYKTSKLLSACDKKMDQSKWFFRWSIFCQQEYKV